MDPKKRAPETNKQGDRDKTKETPELLDEINEIGVLPTPFGGGQLGLGEPIVSMNEMTGFVPAPIVNEGEVEAYAELYKMDFDDFDPEDLEDELRR